jgi:hypothetical protein
VNNLNEYVARKTKQFAATEHPFDPSSLLNVAQEIRHAYETGERITVAFYFQGKPIEVKRGTIEVTTGWKPCFLLISRVNAFGSSDTIDMHDKVVPHAVFTAWNKALRASQYDHDEARKAVKGMIPA